MDSKEAAATSGDPSPPLTAPPAPQSTSSSSAPPQPQAPSSSTPSTPEFPPQSSSSSSSAVPNPPQSQKSQAQPRPSLSSSRPQGPFPHFSTHLQPTASPSTPMQRGGMALGVPAHHPRPHQPGQSFFGPSTPFGGLSRPDQSPMSGAHVRQPVPGIQTIGMIGSISSGSQLRPGGIAGQHQPRLGQPYPRSITPATGQALSTQKMPTHGISRAPSMASPSTPSPGSQNPKTLQQQWMANQGKQMQGPLSSSSYRPQVKQQDPLQRSHLSQQQQQQIQRKNQPLHFQQMQQQQASLSNQSQEHHQQYLPSRSQQMLPPQQVARSHASVPQKSTIPASLQPGLAPSAAATPFVNTDAGESGNQILSKRSIRELVCQIDPSEKLDPEVEDVLIEIAEDFIESVTTFACSLAKHRKSTTLEAKDILLHVERNWNMTLPGFSGDEIKSYKKPYTNEIHKERLAVIKKSMAGSGDSGSSKNSASAQASASTKAHGAKQAPNPLSSPKA